MLCVGQGENSHPLLCPGPAALVQEGSQCCFPTLKQATLRIQPFKGGLASCLILAFLLTIWGQQQLLSELLQPLLCTPLAPGHFSFSVLASPREECWAGRGWAWQAFHPFLVSVPAHLTHRQNRLLFHQSQGSADSFSRARG